MDRADNKSDKQGNLDGLMTSDIDETEAMLRALMNGDNVSEVSYESETVPSDPEMNQQNSIHTHSHTESQQEPEVLELTMLKRSEVKAVASATNKWRKTAGIRKQMSFESGNSTSDRKQDVSATNVQQDKELTMLKRSEVKAVEGVSNKWRDTAGVRRQISFQSENTLSTAPSFNTGSTKLSSPDRSLTIIDGRASESFGIATSEMVATLNENEHTEQRLMQQSSERNIDLRPVVTVDNSLLIKIMDQNQALLEKMNSLNEENKEIQSAQDAQYAVLFEKINQLSKDNQQMRIQNEELTKSNERLSEATRKNDDTSMQLLVRTKQMLGRETRCMLLSNKICTQCEQILTRNDYLVEKQKEILNQLADRFEKLGSSNEKLENHLLPECKTSQDNWLAPPHLGGPLKFSHATFDTVNEMDGTVKYHGDLIAQCLNPYLDDLQTMSGNVEDLGEHFSRMEKSSETRLKRIETMLEVLYRPNIASRTSVFDENYSSKSSKEDLYSKSNHNLKIHEKSTGRHAR